MYTADPVSYTLSTLCIAFLPHLAYILEASRVESDVSLMNVDIIL